MPIQVFDIVFDRSSKVYYSGEKVTGHVLVDVDQKESIEALGIRLWGKASVSWMDGSGKSGKPSLHEPDDDTLKTKTVSDHPNLVSEEESYFDRRLAVLEKSGPEDIVIPLGKNSYSFEISLPSGIPSSFRGDHGQINYFLQAIVKRRGSEDKDVTRPFFVNGILDLNNNLDAQVERPEVASEKHLCCLCCKSGPIGFHFRILGKSGWMSGDKIPFTAEAYNMSSAGAVCLTVRFMQTITYTTKDKSNVVTKELLNMKGPCISRGGTGLWNNENIDLPQNLPPTKLAGKGQIINVEYNFDVVLEIPRGSNISAQIPIVIGTVPVGSTVDEVIMNGLGCP